MSNCMDYSLTLLFFFSDDTVFIIPPLAEEYQVSEVKGRCEHFVIQTLEKAINYEIKRPDLHTLLRRTIQLALCITARCNYVCKVHHGVIDRSMHPSNSIFREDAVKNLYRKN